MDVNGSWLKSIEAVSMYTYVLGMLATLNYTGGWHINPIKHIFSQVHNKTTLLLLNQILNGIPSHPTLHHLSRKTNTVL